MRNTEATISLGALQNNAACIRKALNPGVLLCAVVKADAYGHGLIPVAKRLQQSGADYLAVAIVEEGLALRDAGITIPILVMGPISERAIEACLANNLTMTVPSLEKLAMVAAVALTKSIPARIHLKIDTGMGRIGVHWDRAHAFVENARTLHAAGSIVCEGIYSHFSNSLDPAYTKLQYERFMGVVGMAEKAGLSIPLKHLSSSRSIFLYPEYQLSMVRPGIALYGIEPEPEYPILPYGFAPVLTLTTEVAYFKVVMKGETVGYGNKWTPESEYARVVTLPVGYADGLPRRLSNIGRVIIHGKIYPIVGGVCMDQCMVSLGENGEAYVGDQVILIGKDGDAKISAEDIAALIGTASHEITTTISSRVPRVWRE